MLSTRHRHQRVCFLYRNNEEWFVLRKAAQRAILRQKAMNKYLPIISAVADDFVDKFRQEERIDNLLHHLMEFSTEGKHIWFLLQIST